ncbi:pyridoxal kinase [Methylocapsa sp. D3K7]|uniref:pyridoxal kinase n=1 Tax=Methylocapsa sp. D3K7 TaxID=3041435 RepID=UPI00244EC897|nr:pyridoxal kinase [Methylocapsa sp. D3K7]WGJ13353.1 pyridoxal kinase [Methylocapsa sp. D3K7]
MTVISIQSQVVHGHVGNSAAVFPLQARGIEVAAVPTVLLSNHPLYPTMRGRVLNAELVRDLLIGVEERGLVDTCKVLITGYLGSPEIAAVVIDFVRRAKARNPKLLYLCDPVMGDVGPGFYVNEDLRALFCDALVPLADIITPNQFELEHLVGRAPATVEEMLAMARGLSLSTVVVTGVHFQNASADDVETLAIEPRDSWTVSTPRLSCRPSGTGDLFTALFAAGLIEGLSTPIALGRAVSGVYAVIEETGRRGSYEMALIAAAERLLPTEPRFSASVIPPRANPRLNPATESAPR